MTTVFALLGGSVGHSLSPLMHNAAFAALGLDARYESWDVEPEGLEAVFERARTSGVGGFNVTVPHKTAVVALCDYLSDYARAAGAVNTVVFAAPAAAATGGRSGDDGGGDAWSPGATESTGGLVRSAGAAAGRASAHGHNTDVVAILEIIREWAAAGCPARPESLARGGRGGRKGFRTIVLGAGGAARAAALAAALAGAGEVVVSSREAARASNLAAELSRVAEGAAEPEGAPRSAAAFGARAAFYGSRPAVFRGRAIGDPWSREGGADVLIQATSAPDGALPRLPVLAQGGLAIELNYRPPLTKFLADAAAQGAATSDGLEVLVRQGEAAFRLFTGLEAPPGVMRAAVRGPEDVCGGGGPTTARRRGGPEATRGGRGRGGGI